MKMAFKLTDFNININIIIKICTPTCSSIKDQQLLNRLNHKKKKDLRGKKISGAFQKHA